MDGFPLLLRYVARSKPIGQIINRLRPRRARLLTTQGKGSEGSDLPKTQEMPRRGLRLAQDSDNSNQGRDSVGSDLVEAAWNG
jgi:hypothetical protein